MKNKKLTYFLGFLVLIVWGIIIYRIFDTVVTGTEDDFIPVQNVMEQKDFNDYSLPADTVHLLLNYKDPFRLTKQPDTVAKPLAQLVAIRPLIPKPTFSWNFVKYSGYTQSAGSKKLLAVMSINGQSAILQEGETVAEVKLVKKYQDSVKVTFKGITG